MADTGNTAADAAGPGWDPLVRITHWGIALAVLLNGVFTEEGGTWHVWVGYTAFSLLALRLLWGVAGPWEARFGSFAPSVAAVKRHVSDLTAGRARPRRTHTALGALMAFALWGALGVLTLTGIAMAGSPFAPREAEHAAIEAPSGGLPVVLVDAESEDGDYGANGDEGGEEEGEEMLEEIHETAANLVFLLAALHVGGVLVESRLSGRNLARRMVTGE